MLEVEASSNFNSTMASIRKKRKKAGAERAQSPRKTAAIIKNTHKHLSNEPSAHLLESLPSLQSCCTPVLLQLPPFSTRKRKIIDSTKDDPEFIYKTWLRSKFDDFVKSLAQVLFAPQSEDALRVVLDTQMEFVNLEDSGRFHSAIYHRLLHSIVHSPESVCFVTELFASKYFKYIDVRYFSCISLEKLASALVA